MDREKIIEMANKLPEGEHLWILEFSLEKELWSATSRKWDENEENLETALDYLHPDRKSERGNWVAARRATGATPEDAVANLVSGANNA